MGVQYLSFNYFTFKESSSSESLFAQLYFTAFDKVVLKTINVFWRYKRYFLSIFNRL